MGASIPAETSQDASQQQIVYVPMPSPAYDGTDQSQMGTDQSQMGLDQSQMGTDQSQMPSVSAEPGTAYPDVTGETGADFGYGEMAPTPAPVPKIPTWLPAPSAGTSLYCWALMVATSYERGLLAGQYKQHASIFACNEFEVYSNMSVDLVPGLKSKAVTVNLQCKYGGEFKTALNTPIFITVWSQVVEDARYLEHDWTAKVDADAVFIPERLRMLVTGVTEEPTGVYLTNCKLGM